MEIPMPRDIFEFFGRVLFVMFLAGAFLFGLASLIGYPGPFVLSAFSLGGLPMWYRVRHHRGRLAFVLAAIACVLPFWLLILYTGDGDFELASLVSQLFLLGLLAYGIAWLGLLMGRVVWMP
jgi:hypothetical protein